MNKFHQLEEAIALRKNNQLLESNKLLVSLAKMYPEDATIQYQCAWSFDCMGEETAAVPYYVKAIRGGLTSPDLENAYIGLGSTYRAIGEYQLSHNTFKEALELFPNNEALKIFYAMTLYNLQEYTQSMELLLSSLARTSSDENIKKYKRAIAFYADKLDETWV